MNTVPAQANHQQRQPLDRKQTGRGSVCAHHDAMVKLDANVKCRSTPQLSIGELAEAAGVSTRAVRYYEQHGLVSAQRTPAGHRRFTPQTVERVKLIQRMYSAGLSSASIRPLPPCMVDESQRSKLLIRELRH